MRNYPERDTFQRAIPVLAKGTNIESQEVEAVDYEGDLVFTLQDSVFQESGEKVVSVTLELLDALDENLDASLLVSATDNDLVAHLNSDNDLIQAFEWLDQESDAPASINPQYPIDYGITVEGKFTKTKKRQPDINPITIVRGDLADYGVVSTDSSGYFRASGLNYTDWDTLSIAALDKKQKPYGIVELIPRKQPVFRGSSPRLDYTVYESSATRMAYDQFGDFILLEEFVAEDEKIQALENRYYGYGDPDVEYKPEDLEAFPGTTLDQIIGMRFGNGGLGNFNYGVNAGDPLLIIDGARYVTDSSTQTASDILQTYTTDEVKSIGVYTLNASVFGLAGFAGVIMIETKRGERFSTEEKVKFNDYAFAKFPLKGFAEEIPFPNTPSEQNSLSNRQTLFWDPMAKTKDGTYDFKIYVPLGVNKVDLKFEGVTGGGIPFWWKKTIDLDR